jgi:hypothetical protein
VDERPSARAQAAWFCTKGAGNSGHTWQKRWELQPLLISGGGTGPIPRAWVPARRGGICEASRGCSGGAQGGFGCRVCRAELQKKQQEAAVDCIQLHSKTKMDWLETGQLFTRIDLQGCAQMPTSTNDNNFKKSSCRSPAFFSWTGLNSTLVRPNWADGGEFRGQGRLTDGPKADTV